jgi:hypothetical protein
LANEGKASRERLTLIRLFEELRALGYDGGYDAVRRTPTTGRLPCSVYVASSAPQLKNRLDFCRKGRIAMGAGRWTWPPGETLRARLAMCGALGRASVNSGAANQRSPNDVDPFHKIPEHEERRT